MRGLPSEIHDSMSGNDAEDLGYTYDPDGNTTHINDAATGARTSTLTYDGLDRMTSAAISGVDGGATTHYQYNTLDQITETSQGSHIKTFNYGTSIGRGDWLMSVVDNQTGETDYSYDAQGNLASRGGVGYTFDVGNRLRNVAGEEGGYAYDGYGRRVAQTTNEGTIYSFYDFSGKLIYQRDRTGWSHDYLYLGGKLVAIRDYDTGGIARGLRYQHTDALGSVTRQTDPSGAIIPSDDTVYDAWGRIASGSAQDAPGYTGQVEDSSTGLVYMQQRYYDPNVGRFLSMDPVDASGTNGSNLDRYWYAKDNPYRYTDPTGMCTGTHICNKDGTTPITGGYTTGISGAAQGMRRQQALALRQASHVQQYHPTTGQRAADAVLTFIGGTAFNELKRPNNPTKVPDKFAHQMFMTNASGVALAASPDVVALGTTVLPVAADVAAPVIAPAAFAVQRYGRQAVMAGCLAIACKAGNDPGQYAEQKAELEKMVTGLDTVVEDIYNKIVIPGNK